MINPTDRILDWHPTFYQESRNYPIRTALKPQSQIKLRDKIWKVGPVLDQGAEGACVGYGWTAEVLSTPIKVDLARVATKPPTDPTAFAQYVYNRAKQIDYWAGEDYEGTSVIAGAKTLQEIGVLKEYRWAFSIEDVVGTVLTKGPVVIGINWHYGMYWAPNGVLKVSGSVVGGHCLTVVGYSHKSEKLNGEDGLILQNSWGPEWGINGLAEIKVTDLANLLDADGEACVPFRRSYGRTAPKK